MPEPLALEFTLSSAGDGDIGLSKPDPIRQFNYWKEKDKSGTSELLEMKEQFTKDFFRVPNIMLNKENRDGTITEINIAKELEGLCISAPNDFKKITFNAHPESAFHFDNAYAFLTQKHNFSEEKALLTLSAYTQGGFSGALVNAPFGISNQRMLINIDKKNNFTLKTCSTEYSIEQLTTKQNDLLRDNFPSKNDIFINISSSLGKVNEDVKVPSITTVTIAASSEDGIQIIRELQKTELQKDLKPVCKQVPFEEQQNLCLATLGKFTTPEKLISDWNKALNASSAKELDETEVKDYFKNETLPIIIQMIIVDGKKKNEKSATIATKIVSTLESAMSELSDTKKEIFTADEKQKLTAEINTELENIKTGEPILERIVRIIKNSFKYMIGVEQEIYNPEKKLVDAMRDKLDSHNKPPSSVITSTKELQTKKGQSR
jgi:hypothetical protein